MVYYLNNSRCYFFGERKGRESGILGMILLSAIVSRKLLMLEYSN